MFKSFLLFQFFFPSPVYQVVRGHHHAKTLASARPSFGTNLRLERFALVQQRLVVARAEEVADVDEAPAALEDALLLVLKPLLLLLLLLQPRLPAQLPKRAVQALASGRRVINLEAASSDG